MEAWSRNLQWGDEADGVAAGLHQIEKAIARHLGARTTGSTPIPGLSVTRLLSNGGRLSYLFEPSLCIAVRGAKLVTLGAQTYRYDQKTLLLTTVGLPTIVQVEGASEESPYASLQLYLDLDMARQLITDMELNGHQAGSADTGMVLAPLTQELLDPVLRLVGLLERPPEISILAAGFHREILYRLLTGAAGARLREAVRLGTQGNRAAKAVAWLRKNFTSRLSLDELAREAGMAVSTLHHHFKVMTSMSPLQFQKHLRLHEARRLMLMEDIDVGVAAVQVGYESVTQFSREYRRLFDAPPRRDILALRAAGAMED